MKAAVCRPELPLPLRFVALWILLVVNCCHTASAMGTQLSAAQEGRAHRLYELFVAPCCWRQCVADHQSPAAAQLRDEIDQAVANGKSDSAVKAQLIQEFGKRILRVPEGKVGVFLFLVPGVAVILSLLGLIAWLHRRSNVQASALPELHSEDEYYLELDS